MRNDSHSAFCILRSERVLKVLSSSLRSWREHKAQGGAEGETLGQVGRIIKPVKRAADYVAVAHFVGSGSFSTELLGLTPPGFMLSHASQAQIGAFKTRSQ